jgi:hypothetical protein
MTSYAEVGDPDFLFEASTANYSTHPAHCSFRCSIFVHFWLLMNNDHGVPQDGLHLDDLPAIKPPPSNTNPCYNVRMTHTCRPSKSILLC